MTTIPNNYRQLTSDEVYKNGDLYYNIHRPLEIQIIRCGEGIATKHYPDYKFFRRRHTKKVKPTIVLATGKTKAAVVSFCYPHNCLPVTRTVQVISMDSKYLTGLERTCAGSKFKYQFKRFTLNKMRTAPVLVSYDFPE
jgi:hypothetical protein